jgi:hypothetical protein
MRIPTKALIKLNEKNNEGIEKIMNRTQVIKIGLGIFRETF